MCMQYFGGGRGVIQGERALWGRTVRCAQVQLLPHSVRWALCSHFLKVCEQIMRGFAARKGTEHALGNKCNLSVQPTAFHSCSWFLGTLEN